MDSMEKKFIVLIILQCFLIGSINTDSSEASNKDVSILLVGMSGSGIFSTADMLTNGKIQKTSNANPLVTEYSWTVPSNNTTDEDERIKIATCPGLVNGKTSEQDARTLETVKEYIQSPSGLNKSYPSIMIVVSRFDDRRAHGINSNFVRMLKSVELIREYLGPNNLSSSNIIFHLTFLMSTTRDEARKPYATIDKFKNIIREFTTFPEPISVTIGENRPDAFDLPQNGGYTQLPNKQLYPKNLIDKMKSILLAHGDFRGINIIDKFFQDQYNRQNPIVKIFARDEDKQAIESEKVISNTLNTTSFDTDTGTEINQALQMAYGKLDQELINHPTILQLVQMAFQRLNITRRDQLPKTTLDTVELFQNIPLDKASLALVKEAFNLRQPEFIYPPVVGQGYDILKDETVTNSPFVISNYQPTPIGYSLPNILVCRMENANAVDKFRLIQSYAHYKENRLHDLDIREQVNSTVFVGTVRSGYNNLNPDANAFVAITAVQEIHNFKLSLIESSPLDGDFQDDVNKLSAFNQSDRESPINWQAFFNKYGTHVVSEAFGGGYMEGKVSGADIRDTLRHNVVLYGIKDNLLSFRSMPNEVNGRNLSISHSFFGGSADPQLAEAHQLPSIDRQNLLRQWRNSMRYNPRIMEFNLKLIPIATIARLVNDDRGHKVQKALDHLLKGTLVYIRRKSPKQSTESPLQRISSTTAASRYIYTTTRDTIYTTTLAPTTTAANLYMNPISGTYTPTVAPSTTAANWNIRAHDTIYTPTFEPTTAANWPIMNLRNKIYTTPLAPTTTTNRYMDPISETYITPLSPTTTAAYRYINPGNEIYTTTLAPTIAFDNYSENSKSPPFPAYPRPLMTGPTIHIEEKQEAYPLPKSSDFTNNVIGQGYHLLNDSILPGSPFSLKIESDKGVYVPRGTSVEEMPIPCIYMRFEKIPTYSDYIALRLNSTYKPLIPALFPDGGPEYSGSIRPGYNIMNNLSKNGPFSLYEENRYFEVKADFTKFDLKPEFVADMRALPIYTPFTKNCTVQEKWITFFNKYGTHIVTEGYAGYWQSVVVKGLRFRYIRRPAEVRNPNYETGECLPPKTLRNKNTVDAVVAIESVKLETLKYVVYKMIQKSYAFRSQYDVVMMAMLENKLKGC